MFCSFEKIKLRLGPTKKSFQVMKSFFDQVKERAKAGDFMVPGGFKILKETIEVVERNYQITRNFEEMGPQFSAVHIQYQQNEVSFNLSKVTLLPSFLPAREASRRVPYFS